MYVGFLLSHSANYASRELNASTTPHYIQLNGWDEQELESLGGYKCNMVELGKLKLA